MILFFCGEYSDYLLENKITIWKPYVKHLNKKKIVYVSYYIYTSLILSKTSYYNVNNIHLDQILQLKFNDLAPHLTSQ